MLTGPQCGWPRSRVTKVLNEPHPGNIGDQLIREFKDVRDVALFYYVGHGQIDTQNELCLALTGTAQRDVYRRAATSLTFTAVRDALLESEAATKIVILDCCFAGQAILRMNVLSGASVVADDELSSLVADKARTNGAYVMAAAGPYSEALYEKEGRSPQTYFTKYLVDLVERGIEGEPRELTLGALYGRLERNLTADGHPRPQDRNIEYGYEFVFARNTAPDPGLRESVRPAVEYSQVRHQDTASPLFETTTRAQPTAHRRIPRMVLAGTSGAILVAAVGVTLAVLRTPHAGNPATPLTHAFTLASDHSLDVHRQWAVTGSSHPTFTETLTVSNPTGSLLQVPFNEPVPVPVVSELGNAHFMSETPTIMDSGHVVDWQLRVPAHKAVTYGYTVDLATAEVSAAQFGQWVTQFSGAAAAVGPSKPGGLQSLAIRPPITRLTVGVSAQLTLSGVLSNGAKAPQADLSGVAWQSANSSVVAVTATGKIKAVRPGSTVITARVHGVTASIHITVSATPTPTPGGTYQPSGTQPASAPSSSSPATSTQSAPSSKPSSSPTVIVTTPPPI